MRDCVFLSLFIIFSFQNSFKGELINIFNNIDIESGIDNIIETEKSKLNFDYYKDKIPLVAGYDETWIAKIINHDYFKNEVDSIELELHRTVKETENNCYDIILRVDFSNKERLNSEYKRIFSSLMELGGELFEDEYIIEDSAISFITTSIQKEDELGTSLIIIGTVQNRILNKFTLTIVYDNCPAKY